MRRLQSRRVACLAVRCTLQTSTSFALNYALSISCGQYSRPSSQRYVPLRAEEPMCMASAGFKWPWQQEQQQQQQQQQQVSDAESDTAAGQQQSQVSDGMSAV